MSVLLEKTRKINRLIQNAAGCPVSFDEMAGVLRDVIRGDVLAVSRKGKVMGSGLIAPSAPDVAAGEAPEGSELSVGLNDDILAMRDTAANIKLKGGCAVAPNLECRFEGKVVAVVPVYGGGERLGTLVVVRSEQPFDDDDLLLMEYAATVVGMEVLRSKSAHIEDEARKKAAVQVALSTLSYSELEAVEHIFNELNGSEGLLVASKIADRVGITRSVIVNALRKFESAGVIESRSLGMKGTYIRVKNDRFIEELRKLRAR